MTWSLMEHALIKGNGTVTPCETDTVWWAQRLMPLSQPAFTAVIFPKRSEAAAFGATAAFTFGACLLASDPCKLQWQELHAAS